MFSRLSTDLFVRLDFAYAAQRAHRDAARPDRFLAAGDGDGNRDRILGVVCLERQAFRFQVAVRDARKERFADHHISFK